MLKKRAWELSLVGLLAAAYGCEDDGDTSQTSEQAEGEHAQEHKHDKRSDGSGAAGKDVKASGAAGKAGAGAAAKGGAGGATTARPAAGSGGSKASAPNASDDAGPGADEAASAFALTSSAVADGEKLPKQYRCEMSVGSPTGPNPPLSWSGAPAATKSFALVLRDRTFMNYQHWTIYDIPAATANLPEGVPVGATTEPEGAKQADNSRGLTGPGYYGPCGQSGMNNYEFVLYALDVESLTDPGSTGASVETALADHVLAMASLAIVSGPE